MVNTKTLTVYSIRSRRYLFTLSSFHLKGERICIARVCYGEQVLHNFSVRDINASHSGDVPHGDKELCPGY